MGTSQRMDVELSNGNQTPVAQVCYTHTCIYSLMLSANTDPCASNLNHDVHKNKCVHCLKHINA